jgi:hypothetical protein
MLNNVNTSFHIQPSQSHLKANCNEREGILLAVRNVTITPMILDLRKVFRFRFSGVYSFTCVGSGSVLPYNLLRILKYEEICCCDHLYLFIVLQSINDPPAGRINNSFFFKAAKCSLVSPFPDESENALVRVFRFSDLAQCFPTLFALSCTAITYKTLKLTNRR